jgi:predicted transglutaminase-like cysteine proteinase
MSIALALITLLVFAPVFGTDFDRLQQSLMSRFGPAPMQLFKEWEQMLGESRNINEQEKLRTVNNFFNRRVAFDDDITIWGQSDYWATPMESIGKGRADCEDFSIAKYYSLIEIGVPVNKLRLVYVKAQLNGSLQAHMVLAYYSSPSADPVILDNLVSDIRPASRRGDLSPIFSFNSAGLWQGTGNQSSNSSLSRWQDLLQRARIEGFK